MDITEGFLSGNKWMNKGVATQTGNQLKCPGAKGADERISEMMKDMMMKR